MKEYGLWLTDVPLTPTEYDEDKALLDGVVFPDGVEIKDMTVWVHGREYRRERIAVWSFGREQARP